MNNTKKGFTLVELLVVIAILAILATVSVVGYTSFINRANVSNDEATIGMINNNLQAEFVTGKPETAGEAISALYALGFSNDKLVAYTKGYHYVYDLGDNKFYLANDKGEIVFPEAKTDKSNMWGLYRDGGSDDKVEGISQYVFMKTPTNHYNFANAFGTGSYTLDMNNYFLSLSTEYSKDGVSISNNDGNLKVLYGGTALGLKFAEGSQVSTYKTLADIPTDANGFVLSGLISGSTLTFDGYAFLGGGNGPTNGELGELVSKMKSTSVIECIEFKNCVFTDFNSVNDFGWRYTKDEENKKHETNVSEILIEGCVFTDVGSLSINTNDKVIIRNNQFINCTSGISVTAQMAEGSIIEGNTFILVGNTETTGWAIQIANVSPAYYHGEAAASNIRIDENRLTITNNVIENARSFVHLNGFKDMPLPQNDVTYAYASFSNNTLPENLIKVSWEAAGTENDWMNTYQSLVK